jgi:hypothetical protein
MQVKVKDDFIVAGKFLGTYRLLFNRDAKT